MGFFLDSATFFSFWCLEGTSGSCSSHPAAEEVFSTSFLVQVFVGREGIVAVADIAPHAGSRTRYVPPLRHHGGRTRVGALAAASNAGAFHADQVVAPFVLSRASPGATC